MDRQLAARLARCSQYVYGDSTSGAPPGLQEEQKFSDTVDRTSHAALLRFPECHVLAFQGTITKFAGHSLDEQLLSLRDWLHDLECKSVRALDLAGKVHQGFSSQLAVIAEPILAALAQREVNLPLYLTGHSQGGAIAALATALLATRHIPVAATYTFAAPRPGDATFCDAIETPLVRIEFGCDVVPHVPLTSPFRKALSLLVDQFEQEGGPLDQVFYALRAASKPTSPYASAGGLYYCRDIGRPFEDFSAWSETWLLVERASRMWRHPQRMIDDHAIGRYIEALERS